MPKATLTLWFIVAALVVIFGVDLVFIALRGYEHTVSWTIYVWSREFPVVSFLIGFTMGHLFWPNAVPRKEKERAT